MQKYLNLRSNIALGLIFAFLLNTFGPLPVHALEGFYLPATSQMVALSPAFSPVVLKGIKLDPKHPFRFHFFVDRGDDHLSQEELKQESSKLIKYFLASLTIPEKDLWVNLSPYEKDRIVPKEFGQTEMGRDLLAQDYMLKQITASLIYPESQLGKEFWRKVYAQAQSKYGTTNIPINTFNKVWIVPEKAVVYENGGVAFVLENHLKVMLEQDYLSIQKHNLPPLFYKEGVRGSSKDINSLGSQIIRQIVIPALTKEVNEGKNFAQLRQVFYSLILATWYKKKIKDSILNKVYSNQNKIGGVNVSVDEKEKIYKEYLKAFKKGAYNYIKEELDPITSEVMPRKYFSGGVGACQIGSAETFVTPAMLTDKDKAAIAQASDVEIIGDLAMNSADTPAGPFIQRIINGPELRSLKDRFEDVMLQKMVQFLKDHPDLNQKSPSDFGPNSLTAKESNPERIRLSFLYSSQGGYSVSQSLLSTFQPLFLPDYEPELDHLTAGYKYFRSILEGPHYFVIDDLKEDSRVRKLQLLEGSFLYTASSALADNPDGVKVLFKTAAFGFLSFSDYFIDMTLGGNHRNNRNLVTTSKLAELLQRPDKKELRESIAVFLTLVDKLKTGASQDVSESQKNSWGAWKKAFDLAIQSKEAKAETYSKNIHMLQDALNLVDLAMNAEEKEKYAAEKEKYAAEKTAEIIEEAKSNPTLNDSVREKVLEATQAWETLVDAFIKDLTPRNNQIVHGIDEIYYEKDGTYLQIIKDNHRHIEQYRFTWRIPVLGKEGSYKETGIKANISNGCLTWFAPFERVETVYAGTGRSSEKGFLKRDIRYIDPDINDWKNLINDLKTEFSKEYDLLHGANQHDVESEVSDVRERIEAIRQRMVDRIVVRDLSHVRSYGGRILSSQEAGADHPIDVAEQMLERIKRFGEFLPTINETTQIKSIQDLFLSLGVGDAAMNAESDKSVMYKRIIEGALFKNVEGMWEHLGVSPGDYEKVLRATLSTTIQSNIFYRGNLYRGLRLTPTGLNKLIKEGLHSSNDKGINFGTYEPSVALMHAFAVPFPSPSTPQENFLSVVFQYSGERYSGAETKTIPPKDFEAIWLYDKNTRKLIDIKDMAMSIEETRLSREVSQRTILNGVDMAMNAETRLQKVYEALLKEGSSEDNLIRLRQLWRAKLTDFLTKYSESKHAKTRKVWQREGYRLSYPDLQEDQTKENRDFANEVFLIINELLSQPETDAPATPTAQYVIMSRKEAIKRLEAAAKYARAKEKESLEETDRRMGMGYRNAAQDLERRLRYLSEYAEEEIPTPQTWEEWQKILGDIAFRFFVEGRGLDSAMKSRLPPSDEGRNRVSGDDDKSRFIQNMGALLTGAGEIDAAFGSRTSMDRQIISGAEILSLLQRNLIRNPKKLDLGQDSQYLITSYDNPRTANKEVQEKLHAKQRYVWFKIKIDGHLKFYWLIQDDNTLGSFVFDAAMNAELWKMQHINNELWDLLNSIDESDARDFISKLFDYKHSDVLIYKWLEIMGKVKIFKSEDPQEYQTHFVTIYKDVLVFEELLLEAANNSSQRFRALYLNSILEAKVLRLLASYSLIKNGNPAAEQSFVTNLMRKPNRDITEFALSSLEEMLKKNGTALREVKKFVLIGPGNGVENIQAIAERCSLAQIIVLDWSAGVVNFVRSHLSELSNRVKVEIADARHMGKQNDLHGAQIVYFEGVFDVYNKSNPAHQQALLDMIKEAHQILAPEGFLYIDHAYDVNKMIGLSKRLNAQEFGFKDLGKGSDIALAFQKLPNSAMLARKLLFQGQNSKTGGIDFDPAQMSMLVKKSGQDFKFDFNGTEIDAAQVTGATFTIRTMTPVINLSMELGLSSPKKEEVLAKV